VLVVFRFPCGFHKWANVYIIPWRAHKWLVPWFYVWCTIIPCSISKLESWVNSILFCLLYNIILKITFYAIVVQWKQTNENNEGVIRSRRSKKSRQYNSQKKQDRRTHNGLQNTRYKTKDWATRTQQKHRSKLFVMALNRTETLANVGSPV